MAIKFVLVEIILVETVLVGDPLCSFFCVQGWIYQKLSPLPWRVSGWSPENFHCDMTAGSHGMNINYYDSLQKLTIKSFFKFKTQLNSNVK